jgi:hypothetical protein
MTEKEIYLVLSTFSENRIRLEKSFEKIDSIGWSDFLSIIDFSEKREYLDNNSGEYSISGIGKTYFLELKNEIEQTEKDKIAERQKLRNEAIISERTIKTFWAVFIFGLFGGIYSAYDLFNKITSNKEVPKEQVTKQEMEEELSKLRTLFLTQKKGDSLRIPNSELNK